jgi:lycopene cyclase domain-containing protein
VYEYLILNIVIILFPFILSFEKRISFYKRWKALLISILSVGALFIFWDELFSGAHYWAFNDDFITGLMIMDLPIEELLFFITVPYACLFSYEVIVYFFKDHKMQLNGWIPITIGIGLIIFGMIFYQQYYTLVVSMVTGSVLILLGTRWIELVRSSNFWIYTIVTFLLFLIFNTLLTSLPIVTYNSSMIMGGQDNWDGGLYTIRVEDILYNFSMLTLYLIIYLWFRKENGQHRVDSSQ